MFQKPGQYDTDELRLCLFERKILRCIFGAEQENGVWRKRYNCELYRPDIVNYIEVKRVAWAGHVVCVNNRALEQLFSTKPEGIRNVGRPKLRLEDDVNEDMKTGRVPP